MKDARFYGMSTNVHFHPEINWLLVSFPCTIQELRFLIPSLHSHRFCRNWRTYDACMSEVLFSGCDVLTSERYLTTHKFSLQLESKHTAAAIRSHLQLQADKGVLSSLESYGDYKDCQKIHDLLILILEHNVYLFLWTLKSLHVKKSAEASL